MSQPQSDALSNGDPKGAAPHELPPVEPPSAGFILQLFVIPAVIVAVLVVVVALFGKLAEGKRDASEYLRAIQEDNENVRWRAAFELANLIQNEPELARDTKLLAGVTALLAGELAKAKPGDDPSLRRYLAATLGVFQTLDVPATAGSGRDPLGTLVEALAPAQPVGVRVAAAESLARQAARLNGTLADGSVIKALAEAARADDPELRQRAVFALGFCDGPAALEVLRDRAANDEDRPTRYNAASALARRGDLAARDTLREMLSPADLLRSLDPSGSNDTESRNRAETIEIEALRALQTSVRQGHPELARELRPQLAALQRSPLSSVRVEADALWKNLQTKR